MKSAAEELFNSLFPTTLFSIGFGGFFPNILWHKPRCSTVNLMPEQNCY